MDGKEYLLKLIDECLDNENKIENKRIELDPGFIAVRIGKERFIINVDED